MSTKSRGQNKIPYNALKWKRLEVDPNIDFGEGFVGIEELDGDTNVFSFDDGSTKNEEVPATNKKRKKNDEMDGPLPKKQKLEHNPKGSQKEKKRKSKSKKNSQKKPFTRLDASNPVEESNATDEKKLPLQEEEKEGKVENMEIDISRWTQYELHPLLIKGLRDLGFQNPTPIQQLSLPHGLTFYKDIIGAAETGSGKTLAFGLPILHRLILMKEKEKQKQKEEQKEEKQKEEENENKNENENESEKEKVKEGTSKDEKKLSGLIITPTRELAMQIVDHLKAVAKYVPFISIIAVVGGIAIPKQERLLSKKPDIIVATPGRFWEMMDQNPYLHFISSIRFLVIDEADRMIERGHFKELKNILKEIQADDPNIEKEEEKERKIININKKKKINEDKDKEGEESDPKQDDEKSNDDNPMQDEEKSNDNIPSEKKLKRKTKSNDNNPKQDEEKSNDNIPSEKKLKRQTFVFSATLTLTEEGRKRLGGKRRIRKSKKQTKKEKSKKGKKVQKKESTEPTTDKAPDTMDRLLEMINFQRKVEIIDVSNKDRPTAENLTESKIECLLDEKDRYLYYFLLRYPGRTLVFVILLHAFVDSYQSSLCFVFQCGVFMQACNKDRD